MIEQARKKCQAEIFKLGGPVYALDSTTIDLCLEMFEWAKFRQHKGGVKMHTLFDVETQITDFVYITTASVHDTKAMPKIPYEQGAHYIFDRGYNDFSNLNTIALLEASFIFLTNNMTASPETISMLYRNRWSIELFFK